MKILRILLLLLISSCSQVDKKLEQQRKSFEFDKWEEFFKERALCLCLLEGYENNEIKNYILKNDKSYQNGLSIAIFDKALSPIIIQESIKIHKDSIESVDKVPEHLVGKKIFKHCIDFYKSKRLDSIVKIESEKWKEIKDIQSEIWKTIPTY